MLWELQPEAMPRLLERHEQILVATVEQAGGRVFNRSGDGFAAVFATVADVTRRNRASAVWWTRTGASWGRSG